MIDAKLLKVLCCPANKQSLRPADDETVARLNAGIPAGNLRTTSGEVVRDPFEAGLVREDGEILYPVRAGVPVLLVSAGMAIGDDKSAETPKRAEETADSD